MKNTKQLQLDSVTKFAKHLQYELVIREDGHMFFQGEKNIIKMQKMINWHNGNVGRMALWHTRNEVLWVLAAHMHLGLTFDQTERIEEWRVRLDTAFDTRLVEQAKLVWSSKKKELRVEDHRVKLMPGVEL